VRAVHNSAIHADDIGEFVDRGIAVVAHAENDIDVFTRLQQRQVARLLGDAEQLNLKLRDLDCRRGLVHDFAIDRQLRDVLEALALVVCRDRQMAGRNRPGGRDLRRQRLIPPGDCRIAERYAGHRAGGQARHLELVVYLLARPNWPWRDGGLGQLEQIN